MKKSNMQIKQEVLEQLKNNTLYVYEVDNDNFFNEETKFLEDNKLLIIPILSETSYDLVIVKEDQDLSIRHTYKSNIKEDDSYYFEKPEPRKNHLRLVV